MVGGMGCGMGFQKWFWVKVDAGLGQGLRWGCILLMLVVKNHVNFMGPTSLEASNTCFILTHGTENFFVTLGE